MQEVPQISDAEWQVMKVIWADSPVKASEVIDELANTSYWKPKTIKTMLRRLVDKKVLGYYQEGKSYLYYPIVSERDSIKAESDFFLKKVFNGSLNLMLASFIEEEKLSQQEIEQLRRTLDDKE
ncbi:MULTISPECIES: BlaI/MecI/CopY family transcriptional regulator [Syntrophomonas]|uniref:BlaI/MecI/CopY family transcriptional regulator n=1 Tax=Syntrophomonas wolfei TaxID=863 RepID=A0A354YSV4_9FIRM|nr:MULTISPECIES: BlaI/MecI/CopY family transcriptional regulator [Syntrophomonas]MDD4627583.1 BlaI/MecI/CopY family transcriptional regulator [Syntrophomonas sp.]HBK52443.1 BlaI/MecI/CopY family transcriptional regulator [Syntrophomonas wolfei]